MALFQSLTAYARLSHPLPFFGPYLPLGSSDDTISNKLRKFGSDVSVLDWLYWA